MKVLFYNIERRSALRSGLISSKNKEDHMGEKDKGKKENKKKPKLTQKEKKKLKQEKKKNK